MGLLDAIFGQSGSSGQQSAGSSSSSGGKGDTGSSSSSGDGGFVSLNFLDSKQGTTASGSAWVNPSSDPTGKGGQLHIHPHENGTTISLYKDGHATNRVTYPKE